MLRPPEPTTRTLRRSGLGICGSTRALSSRASLDGDRSVRASPTACETESSSSYALYVDAGGGLAAVARCRTAAEAREPVEAGAGAALAEVESDRRTHERSRQGNAMLYGARSMVRAALNVVADVCAGVSGCQSSTKRQRRPSGWTAESAQSRASNTQRTVGSGGARVERQKHPNAGWAARAGRREV